MFHYLVTRERNQTSIDFNIHNPNNNERVAIIQYWLNDKSLTVASKNINGYNCVVVNFQDVFDYCLETLTNNQKIIAVYIARTIGIDC